MAVNTPAEVLNRRFPAPVRLAQVNLVMREELWDLPSRVLRLAQIFVSHTPLSRLDNPVICSREKAANLLEVSIRSVSRYTAQLEKRGLVQVADQRRRKGGDWECLTIFWTPFGRTFFGNTNTNTKQDDQTISLSRANYQTEDTVAVPSILISPTKDAASSDEPANLVPVAIDVVQDVSRGTNLAHRTTSLKSKELSIENNPACVQMAKKPKTPDLSRLPAGIVKPARELGLNGKQVCLLFRECKQKGHRLQDVLAVYMTTMVEKSLRGRDAMGWIRSLLKVNQDYRSLAQEQQKKEELEIKRMQDEARLEVAANSLRPGQLLPSGRVVRDIVDGVASFIDPATGNKAGSQPVAHLVRDLENHGLEKSLTQQVNTLHQAVPTIGAVQPDADFAEQSSERKSESPGREAISAMKELLNKNRFDV